MKFDVEKVDNFTGHRDSVYSLQAGKDEGTFYSSSGDGMIVKWDLKTPDLGMPIAKVNNSVYAFFFDKENEEIWLGHNYEGIHIIDSKIKKEVSSIAMSKSAIYAVEGYKDDIFVGNGDGVISIIDRKSRSFRKHIKASDKSVRCIAINPVEQEFAVGYSDHKIRIFDLNGFQLKKEIAAHSNSVFGLKYSKNYEELYSVSRDAHLKKWSVLQKYELEEKAVAHMYTIHDIAFSPSGKYFATCSMDKSIKLWETENFKLRKVIDKGRHASHGTSINKLLWLNDHDLLAASDDRTISFWKISVLNE